jgi:Cd(II)/Pb(II)-responsive transcriptional regulator
MDNLKIGDLARRTQCQAETIRYYEREGLLPAPNRTAGNYRVYGQGHIDRLLFIRNCRLLDMTLDEIRQLLRLRDTPQKNCDAAHALLDEHIAHVSSRLAELKLLERQLKALREQCGPLRDDDKECGILDGLGYAASGIKGGLRGAKKGSPHIRGTHDDYS